MSARTLRVASALVLGLSCTSVASAHAPLLRRVAVSPDAGALTLSLPGFGLLVRRAPEQPFVYLCSAMLGMSLTDFVPSLAYMDDGSLLMTSIDGVRFLGADGCPRPAESSNLAAATVIMSTVAPSASATVYAVVAGAQSGLWRSDDGGHAFTLRAPLAAAETVSALVVSADDPQHVFLSQGSTLLFSRDGGATLERVSQTSELTLLFAEGGASDRLWAMANDAESVGKRGLAIMRADGPRGPFRTMTRVNYFGGFVIDEAGVIWLGDEGGGMLRSDDGGDSFVNVAPDQAVACLASSEDALWTCTPGVMQDTALARLMTTPPLTMPLQLGSIVAFTDVVQLASCPDQDVPRTCAAAWFEWQRDVLLRDLRPDGGVSSADAGTPTEGPTEDIVDAGSAPSLDAGTTPSAPATDKPAGDAGCSLSGAETPSSRASFALALLGFCLRRTQKRRRNLTDCSVR